MFDHNRFVTILASKSLEFHQPNPICNSIKIEFKRSLRADRKAKNRSIDNSHWNFSVFVDHFIGHYRYSPTPSNPIEYLRRTVFTDSEKRTSIYQHNSTKVMFSGMFEIHSQTTSQQFMMSHGSRFKHSVAFHVQCRSRRGHFGQTLLAYQNQREKRKFILQQRENALSQKFLVRAIGVALIR